MSTSRVERCPGTSEPTVSTVAEYAKRWKLSKKTVYSLAASGQIEAVKLGGSLRIIDRVTGLQATG